MILHQYQKLAQGVDEKVACVKERERDRGHHAKWNVCFEGGWGMCDGRLLYVKMKRRELQYEDMPRCAVLSKWGWGGGGAVIMKGGMNLLRRALPA